MGLDSELQRTLGEQQIQAPLGLPAGSDGKESTCSTEIQVRSLGREDPLEKEVTAHSSVLAWRIPWAEGPGGLQSRGHKEWDL